MTVGVPRRGGSPPRGTAARRCRAGAGARTGRRGRRRSRRCGPGRVRPDRRCRNGSLPPPPASQTCISRNGLMRRARHALPHAEGLEDALRGRVTAQTRGSKPASPDHSRGGGWRSTERHAQRQLCPGHRPASRRPCRRRRCRRRRRHAVAHSGSPRASRGRRTGEAHRLAGTARACAGGNRSSATRPTSRAAASGGAGDWRTRAPARR